MAAQNNVVLTLSYYIVEWEFTDCYIRVFLYKLIVTPYLTATGDYILKYHRKCTNFLHTIRNTLQSHNVHLVPVYLSIKLHLELQNSYQNRI